MKVRHSLRTPDLKSSLLPFIIVIALASACVYANTLVDDFVYDDRSQVLENRFILDIKYIPKILSGSAWSFEEAPVISNYYRPVMNIIYMLNYYIFGLTPWGFHLVNILFHAGNSVLVFLLTWRLFADKFTSEPVCKSASTSTSTSTSTLTFVVPPFIAALLFAVHPIHTEAVAWVAAVPELSFTFLSLLSFYLFIESSGAFNSKYVFSVLLFFAAAFCKETALTLPIILFCYDYAFGKEKRSIQGIMKRYIPYVVAMGIYLIIRRNALEGFAPHRGNIGFFQSLINVFPLFAQYLQKLLLPFNLNAFYVLHPISSFFELKGIIGVTLTAAFLLIAFFFYRKDRRAFLALLLVVVPLLPVLYIPMLGQNAFAERYLYLPSFGFVLLPALLLKRMWTDATKIAKGLTIAMIIAAGFYSLATINRNTVWKDDYSLFKDTVKKSPDAAIPRERYATALLSRNRVDEAVEQYRIALGLDMFYPVAHANLGIALKGKGLLDEAIKHYQLAVALQPGFPKDHFNLAQALREKGALEMAVAEYQTALLLNPDFVLARFNLGITYEMLGLKNKAAEQYKVLAERRPGDAINEFNRGLDLFNQGLTEEAIEHYLNAVRLNPNFADAHNNLGVAYGTAGSVNKAIEHFQLAVKLNPGNATYLQNLSRAIKLKKHSTRTEGRAE